WAVAVDTDGNAWITGETHSGDFPKTDNAVQKTLNGATDAFVSKISADGSTLLYSTYLGGSTGERGSGIATDAQGLAYVTGVTDSDDFPTTSGAAQTNFGGTADGFISKFRSDGATLLASTYLGGKAVDWANGI